MSSSKKNKKQRHIQDHVSISNLNPAQNTKKSISTQQIILEQTNIKSTLNQKPSMHNYSLHLPPGIDISVVIQALKQKIGQQLIYCNQQKGQLIVQPSKKTTFWDLVDCFLCCKIQGSSKGPLAHCYNVYAIRISKQVIQKKCVITIKPSHPKAKDEYYMNLIKLIENEVKAMPQSPSLFHKIHTNNLQFDCPLHRQIIANKKIEQIFNSGMDKRYKVLYQKSIQKVKDQIAKLQQQQSKYKRIDLVDSAVNQCRSLTAAFRYDIQQNNSLHQQYYEYSIQRCVCNSLLQDIHKTYIQLTKDQCLKFNSQFKLINNHLTNQQCWKYLQCRKKYTLPTQNQPYFMAIISLKEIQWANSFRQMLFCVQKCFSQAKVACLIQHKGNLELSTMDDILPVMIYIVIKAGITNFPSYVKMVDDYVRAKGTFQLQQRVITSLYVAVQDITKKWVLTEQQLKKVIGSKNIQQQREKMELEKKKIEKRFETSILRPKKSPSKHNLQREAQSQDSTTNSSKIRESITPLKISLKQKDSDGTEYKNTIDNE